jgi:murein L,D-transpeptidase YcbB/YkuD
MACDEVSRPLKETFSTETSRDHFDQEDFAELLHTCIPEVHQLTDSASIPATLRLAALYTANHFQTLWLQEDGSAPKATQLLKEIHEIRYDGLSPADYQYDSLQYKLQQFLQSPFTEVEEVVALDTLLTATYLHLANDLLMGVISPHAVDTSWHHPNDSFFYWNEIVEACSENNYFPLDSFKSAWKLYNLLRDTWQHYESLSADSLYLSLQRHIDTAISPGDSLLAALALMEIPWLEPISDSIKGHRKYIQAYQQCFGLRRTGKTDSMTLATLREHPLKKLSRIKVNLERIRWLPRTFADNYIVVNIPAMELTFHRQDEEPMRMLTVVGTRARQTPSLMAPLRQIVINPPWGVPPTILKKDVIPGLHREGLAYLHKKGLKVYNAKGEEIDPATMDHTNYKQYFFRQPPGADNALGYVKFNMPNIWDIYLHDTPNRNDFTKYDRAKSSGCIRIEAPRQMAAYILTSLEKRRYPQERIDSVIALKKTRWEPVRTYIPVHIVYITAVEDATGAHVKFTRDIYRKDEILVKALQSRH